MFHRSEIATRNVVKLNETFSHVIVFEEWRSAVIIDEDDDHSAVAGTQKELRSSSLVISFVSSSISSECILYLSGRHRGTVKSS